MSDVNAKFESVEAAQAVTPNFDSVILPNFEQLPKTAQTDAPQNPKEGAAGEQQAQKSLDVPTIATPGWPDSPSQPELSPQRQSMVDAAEAAVGTQPWKANEKGEYTQGGALAGGVNLSAIVRAAGYSDVNAAYIRGSNGVEDQLIKNHGWVKNDISQAKPGDIYIVPHATGSASTVGIVGKEGSLYSHSEDGTVTRFSRPLRSDGYVIAPPEKNG